MNRIADYELVELLGIGNHGELHRAVAPQRLGLDDEFVALKVLAANATDADFARVANELRLFRAVDSPYLVELLDAGQQQGRLFYAMRYHPDGSLDAGPAIDRRVVVQAMVDAARAAHALHEVGIVHRDIKPRNVLLADGRGRLADLALAQVDTPGMTSTGIGPIGSIAYMEPDVIYGERAARSSDVWSLGVTAHYALTGAGCHGELPGTSVLAAFRHVLNTTPTISEGLDTGIAAVLERALSERRSDRHATAAEFADDLARTEGLS